MSDESGRAYYEIEETCSVNPDGTVSEGDKDAAGRIFASWLSTANGQIFRREYANPENFDRIARAVAALGKFLGPAAIDEAFETLRSSGALLRPEPTRAELAQQERRRRESEYKRFADSAPTREVKRRAAGSSEDSKLFAKWLAGRLRDETRPEPPLPLTAEQIDFEKEQARLQREADRKFASVPAEVRQFAERYKRTPASEAAKMQRDPEWRRRVEEAVRYGVL